MMMLFEKELKSST